MAFRFWFYQPDPSFVEGAKIFDVASENSMPTRADWPHGFERTTYIEVREGTQGDSADWPVIKTYLVEPLRFTKMELLDHLQKTGGDAYKSQVLEVACEEWFVWETARKGKPTLLSDATGFEAQVCVLSSLSQVSIACATDPRYTVLV